MKRFFSAQGLYSESGLGFIRIVVGLFLIYHGWEVLDADKMKEYSAWDSFKESSFPLLMVYLGKGSELVAGIMLMLGLLTRVACLVIIGTMLYIAFFIGQGKIWYEDQHPFMFALMAMVFFFTGPGKWSLDGRKSERAKE